MALEVAREEHLSYKIGLVYSEQNPELMAQAFQFGNIEALPGAPEIDRGTVYRFTLNHVLSPESPLSAFRFEVEEIQ